MFSNIFTQNSYFQYLYINFENSNEHLARLINSKYPAEKRSKPTPDDMHVVNTDIINQTENE